MPSMEDQVKEEPENTAEEDFSRYDPLNIRLRTTDDEPEAADEADTDSDPDDEGVETVEGETVWEIDDFREDKVFSTRQVADLCGIKRDYEVRNLMKVWNEYLDVAKDEKGRYKWNREDFIKFQEMLFVKRDRKFTVEETLKYYTEQVEVENEVSELPASPVSRAAIEEYVKGISKSFESVLDAKTNDIKESNAKILEQMEANKKESDDNMQKMMAMMLSMQEAQKQRDEEIKRLQEENAELKAAAEESKKKKPFWKLFD